jgi:hypothetical protein
MFGAGVEVAVGAVGGVARTELVVATGVGATLAVGDGATGTTVGAATGTDAVAGFGVWVVDAPLGAGDAAAVGADWTMESAEVEVGAGMVNAASSASGAGAATMAHPIRISKPLTSTSRRSR